MPHAEVEVDTELEVEMEMEAEPIPEQDASSCPTSCSCQYAAFNELPIARWVNHMTSYAEDDSHLDDSDFLMPSRIKMATCLLQKESETQSLFNALPIDLQALILLHTGSVNNQLTGEFRHSRF